MRPIQNSGLILTFCVDTLVICHISENAELFLNLPARILQGRKLPEVIGAEATGWIRCSLAAIATAPFHEALVTIDGNSAALCHIRMWLKGRAGLLELEPCAPFEDRQQAYDYRQFADTLKLVATADRTLLLSRFADAIRCTSGYNAAIVVEVSASEVSAIASTGLDITDDQLHEWFKVATAHHNGASGLSRDYFMFNHHLTPIGVLQARHHLELDFSVVGRLTFPERDDCCYQLVRYLGYTSYFVHPMRLGASGLGAVIGFGRSPKRPSAALRAALSNMARDWEALIDVNGSFEEANVRIENLQSCSALIRKLTIGGGTSSTPVLVSRYRKEIFNLIGCTEMAMREGITVSTFGNTRSQQAIDAVFSHARRLLDKQCGSTVDNDLTSVTFEMDGCTVLFVADPVTRGEFTFHFPLVAPLKAKTALSVRMLRNLPANAASPLRPLKDSSLSADTIKIVADLIYALRSSGVESRMQSQMDQIAAKDQLTMLPNRRVLEQRAGSLIEDASNHSVRFALLFVDVTELHQINELHGRNVGNQLLIAISRRLDEVAEFRQNLFRLDGNSFAILIDGLLDRSMATILANRIEELFTVPLEIGRLQKTIKISVGMSLFPEHGKSVGTLIQIASDVAKTDLSRMPDATQQLTKAVDDSNMKKVLMAAIHAPDFIQSLSAIYQPVMNLDSGTISGFECLVRWSPKDLGSVSPAVFIPLVERDTLLIQALGTHMMEMSLMCLQTLPAPLGVSLNVSPLQLLTSTFRNQLGNTAERLGISTSRITLELTETAILDASEFIIAELASLRKAGFQIALDDLGTGYSSLHILANLPVSAFKIDRSFIQGMRTSQKHKALVKGLVALAKAMGLECIAEGVENKEDFYTVQECGVQFAQGYFIDQGWRQSDILDKVSSWCAESKMPGLFRDGQIRNVDSHASASALVLT